MNSEVYGLNKGSNPGQYHWHLTLVNPNQCGPYYQKNSQTQIRALQIPILKCSYLNFQIGPLIIP